jgi:hypothetical protein
VNSGITGALRGSNSCGWGFFAEGEVATWNNSWTEEILKSSHISLISGLRKVGSPTKNGRENSVPEGERHNVCGGRSERGKLTEQGIVCELLINESAAGV